MCAKALPAGGRRRVWRALLLSLLLPLFLGLVAGTVLWVRTGRTFRLREWKVAGARLADRQRIVHEMESLRGRPLARIRLDSLKARLAGDPWVTGLRLAKEWPDALGVVLTEDLPLAWVLDSGTARCLAASGRVLPMPRTGVSLDLPVLDGLPAGGLRAARRLGELRSGFPELYARVERLDWGPSLELRLRGAAPRVLLQEAQWRNGLSLLQIVARQRPELLTRPGELDLRFVNQVVWRGDA
jgi:cell division septal protein FtsQ